LGGNTGYVDILLENIGDSRSAVGSLLAVGQLRNGPEFRIMEYESIGGRKIMYGNYKVLYTERSSGRILAGTMC